MHSLICFLFENELKTMSAQLQRNEASWYGPLCQGDILSAPHNSDKKEARCPQLPPPVSISNIVMDG